MNVLKYGISIAFQEDDIEIVGYRHYNTKVFLCDHQRMLTSETVLTATFQLP